MAIRDVLLPALIERFIQHGLRVGAPPGPIAVFPAKHPLVGDVSVRDSGVDTNVIASVSIGEIIHDHFNNYDSHLECREREERVTRDVVRFLEQLFADRLLFWRAIDGHGAGWREGGPDGSSDPLVIDNRRYRTYRWSGPLPVWQAIPTILARGRIQDDREYEIVRAVLDDQLPDPLGDAERESVAGLAADFERLHP